MIVLLKGRKSYDFDGSNFKPVYNTQIETNIFLMKYSSKKIGQDFIDFIDKQHNIVRFPCFSSDDPTLLFINAGMNQFKNIFRKESQI